MRKYYVRVLTKNTTEFLEYAKRHEIDVSLIQECFSSDGASKLFSLMMDGEEALAMRLSLTLKGFIVFDR